MSKKDMKIIDMRKYTGSKSEIIHYEDGEIIFIKDHKLKDKYYCSMNVYNVLLDKVKEIYRYETIESEYTYQYFRVVKEDIIIMKMYFTDKIEVDILDKHSKKLKSKHRIQVDEKVSCIPITINSRYFIFSIDIDETPKNKYREYKEKGYENLTYLCDLKEDEIHLIKDLRIVNGLIVHSLIDYFPTFMHDDEEYMIFNETYMDDYEYEEDIYNAIQLNKLDKDLVTDVEALYLISVNDFAETIKLGKENIPFKEINKRHLDGWVRYLQKDEENIYYREKDFKTQIEKIYAMDQESFKTTVKKEIQHQKIKGRMFYEDKIYEEVQLNEYNKIRGIYNCHYDVSFKKDQNLWFIDFINDRYLVMTDWFEDDNDHYFEFVYIIDVKENKRIQYDGTCKVYNDCVVIYDQSGYWE